MSSYKQLYIPTDHNRQNVNAMNKRHYIPFLIMVSIASSSIPAADTLYDNRFKQWQTKAKAGDSFSQYSLGNAYLRGNEVSIDKKKAIHWFKQAALQGHAKSEYKLGYLYYSGKNVNRDYRTAFEWFERSAKHNYSPAQFYLGKMYAAGQGTNLDYSVALDWLNKALQNDYSPAEREIERTRRKLNREKQETRTSAPAVASKPVINKPVKKIVVAKKRPVIKKSSKSRKSKKSKRQKVDLADLLQQGDWMQDDLPTDILPSSKNECTSNADQIHCKTEEMLITTDYADINYKVESVFGRFDEKRRSFTAKNKTNTLFVLPLDPDDPDVDPDEVPTTGVVTQVMKCKFENNDKIRCYNDEFKKIYFTRN